MKSVIIILFCLLPLSRLIAQDLQSKIPQNANVVASFNTGRLLELMPADEWNNSKLGKKLLELSSKGDKARLTSINDAGINLAGKTYFFHTENDSVHYNFVLMPISDADKFDALFRESGLTKLDNNLRFLADPDSSGLMMWNNQQMLYAKGILKENYFEFPDVIKRYGLFDHYYHVGADSLTTNGDSPDLPVADTAAPVVQEPPVLPKAAKKPLKTKATLPGNKKKPVQKKAGTNAKKTKPKVRVQEEVPVENEVTVELGNNAGPAEPLNDDYLIKKRLATAWTSIALKETFEHPPTVSITGNAGYMKSSDPNAVMSIWIERPTDLYYNLMPSGPLYNRNFSNSYLNRTSNPGNRNFTAKLLFEDKQVRLTSSVELNDDFSGMQQQLFNRKPNKNFLNYINSDSVLGYMSWSLDTKVWMDNFPKMIENAYGSMGLGIGKDEASLGAEFISFLLDEEAIGQLIKGDGMILFNGLYQQQTTYTDYVYDENFKSTAVEKTKTDTLPRFLMMLSSDENNFERKLVSYGIKKEVVKQQEGFYQLVIPKSPVALYFANKDGVFFLTNSISDIQKITTGKYMANISKQEAKYILGHNYSMFLSPAKISGQIANTGVAATEGLASALNTFGKMGNVRAVMNPVESNTMSGELTMEVPANNTNSLKYIFSVIDSFLK